MKKVIRFEVTRTGHTMNEAINHWSGMMTVGDLKELLEYEDDDTYIILSHDNGYTFGSLGYWVDVTYWKEDRDGDLTEVDSLYNDEEMEEE